MQVFKFVLALDCLDVFQIRFYMYVIRLADSLQHCNLPLSSTSSQVCTSSQLGRYMYLQTDRQLGQLMLASNQSTLWGRRAAEPLSERFQPCLMLAQMTRV